jgi:lycopene cyclase domain-containing protein
MTYLLLNSLFLGAVVIAGLLMVKRLPWKAIGLATAALVALTAIFDNVIVGTGIVAYDEALIMGIKIGVAPIEDFAYALAAPLLLSIMAELNKRQK